MQNFKGTHIGTLIGTLIAHIETHIGTPECKISKDSVTA
jgi:hypothetical protein